MKSQRRLRNWQLAQENFKKILEETNKDIKTYNTMVPDWCQMYPLVYEIELDRITKNISV